MRYVLLKEAQDLGRETRLPALLTFFGMALGLVGFVLLRHVSTSAADAALPSFREPLLGFLFVGVLACALFAVTFAADALTRERDHGMLSMLFTSPLTHAAVYQAKALAVFAVYVAYALVNLLVAALLSLSLGTVALRTTFLLVAGPLAALYAFLAGLCLLLGALARTSRGAQAAGVATVLPALLLQSGSPVAQALEAWRPGSSALLAWAPVDAVVVAGGALAGGQAYPAGPVAFAAALGVALAAAGYAVFRRREVAA